MNSGIDVLNVTHNERIVAAHFERKNFLRLRGKLLMQMLSGLRTPREEQAVDARMCGQGNSGLAPALQQIEHPRRQACQLPELHGSLGTGRCEFARFEYHAVTGEECRNDMPVGQMTREIVWAKHRNHTVRAMAQYRRVVRLRGATLSCALLMGANRNIDFAYHGDHLSSSFP